MSPLASAPDAPTRLRSAVEIGFVALAVLVAVGVAILFLALTGASRTGHTPRPQSPSYARPRQYVPASGKITKALLINTYVTPARRPHDRRVRIPPPAIGTPR